MTTLLASQRVRDQHLIRPRATEPTAVDQQRTLASTTVPVVRLTAGGVAHTDGSWVRLIASTAVESSAVRIWSNLATFGSNLNGTMLLDLAIGDGAQNPVSTLVEDYQIGFNIQTFQLGNWGPGYFLWLNIPQGVEVIGRIRSGIASDLADLALMLYGGNAEPVLKTCTTYGAVPASSRGTILTAPGGTNIKSAWTELSAAIANPIYAMGFGVGAADDIPMNPAGMFFDIGAGSAGNERVVVPNVYATFSSSETISVLDPALYRAVHLAQPLGIGERLTARYQTTATTQDMDLIVYGYS